MANHSTFTKDFFWYFLGSFLPLIIGFIKTPIFTRHFDKVDYGHLGLVSITFSYFGMLLFSWIGSCVWRYYFKYREKNALNKLYTNIVSLFFISIVIVFIISSIWYAISKHNLSKQLIFYSFFHLILNQLFLLYLVVIRLQGNAKYYTAINSVRAILGLSTALVLVFIFNMNIVALVLSLALVDALMVLFLVLFNPINITIRLKDVNKNTLRELVTYGAASLVINVGFLMIATSDRYIIAWTHSLAEVGIYDQVYKLGQISVLALVTIYFNTVNPKLLNELESNFKDASILIKGNIKLMISIGLPMLLYLSLLSKDIATVMLGSEFRVGYVILPFVFAAFLLHGISNFYELRMKFSDKLKKLSQVILVIAFLDAILTYIFVSHFDYTWAAITTLFCYLLLLFWFHFLDKEMIHLQKRDFTIFTRILLVLIGQMIIYFLIISSFELNMLVRISIIVGFALTYYFIFKGLLNRVLSAIKITME